MCGYDGQFIPPAEEVTDCRAPLDCGPGPAPPNATRLVKTSHVAVEEFMPQKYQVGEGHLTKNCMQNAFIPCWMTDFDTDSRSTSLDS